MREDIISFAANTNLPFCVWMCGISYCDGSYIIERPKSELNVIEYIISGTGTVNENENVFYPAEGDIYFLKQGRNHLYYSDSDNPWIKIWMNFSGKLADKITEYYGLKNQPLFHAPELKKYFYEIYNAAQSGIGSKQLSEKAAVIFLELVQKLAELYPLKSPVISATAQNAKEYIDEMPEYFASLGEISQKLSYSKTHIIREFKAAYGITPYEYMLNRRFEMAASLLKNTALSITDISEKLGFCDSRYFSSCFTKRFKTTPSAYRKS